MLVHIATENIVYVNNFVCDFIKRTSLT